jgi:hypothetical protein
MDHTIQTILTGLVRPTRNDPDREIITIELPPKRLNEVFCSQQTLIVNVPDADFVPDPSKGRDGKVKAYLKFGLRYNKDVRVCSKCNTIATSEGLCAKNEMHGSSYVRAPHNGTFYHREDEQRTLFGLLRKAHNAEEHEIIIYNLPLREMTGGWFEDDALIINMPEDDTDDLQPDDVEKPALVPGSVRPGEVRVYLKHRVVHQFELNRRSESRGSYDGRVPEDRDNEQ